MRAVEISRHIGLHAALKAIRGMAPEIDKKGVAFIAEHALSLEYTSKAAFEKIAGPPKAMGWDGALDRPQPASEAAFAAQL